MFRRVAVALFLDIGEREREDCGELVDEGRLEGRKPVLRDADQRRADRLVGAAFGRERNAGRRRRQDEARVLIAGVIERIEPAGDERIVQRADRQQPRAVDVVGQPERRMNKFISAMPSSMCWPLGENSQLNVDGMRSLLKVSASACWANSPRRLTHGPRLVETVTSGEVVTMRSASAELSLASSLRIEPNPVWVDITR